jgi:hypothetical protein
MAKTIPFNKLFHYLSIGITLAVFQPSIFAHSVNKSALIGLQSINKTDLKTKLKILASAKFQGRKTGTSGADLAADYIACSFKKNGLIPSSKSPKYLQYFDITQSKSAPSSELRYDSDDSTSYSFKPRDVVAAPWGRATGPLKKPGVFIGYGISAPELGYDDYEGVNINNKIVVMLSGLPEPYRKLNLDLQGQILHGDPINKAILAKKKGATGVILILRENEKLSLYKKNDFKQGRGYLTTRIKKVDFPVFVVTFDAARSLFSKLFREGNLNNTLPTLIQKINSKVFRHYFEFKGKFFFRSSYHRLAIQGSNVIGLFYGSDESLKDEFVMIGGHYDHIGVGANNQIFFGADDNASGIAALLELVEAFKTNKLKPRRSIAFAAFSGEEIGLLGSKYYTENPLVPLEKTVAFLQMDMIGRDADHQANLSNGLPSEKDMPNNNSLNVLGTILVPSFKRIIKENNDHVNLDLKFQSDLRAIELFQRSDQWSFFKRGIPALFFFTGFHLDYHKTSDTPEKINFNKMEKISKLIYLTIWNLANRESIFEFDSELLKSLATDNDLKVW